MIPYTEEIDYNSEILKNTKEKNSRKMKATKT